MNTGIYFAAITVSSLMIYGSCLVHFVHALQNSVLFLFLCVYVEMDRKKREENKTEIKRDKVKI